ncbi:MAG: translation initiation factor IF-2 [Clostridia bacterium]|nr:translation initiation factor IF-2 [Clostridia bacterium]
MMIKYKVSEIAKDLNVAPKEIAAALMEHSGGNAKKKNSQSSLTEEELNIVFEHFTQKNSTENLDEYLSGNKNTENKKTDNKNTDNKNTENAAQPSKDGKRTANDKKFPPKIDRQKNRANNQKQPEDNRKNDNRRKPDPKNTAQRDRQQPAAKNAGASKENTSAKSADSYTSEETTQRRSRVVDTRAGMANIDIERYNEKYDNLASNSSKIKSDNTVSKQKINQKSQRKGKPKNSRKETEQERLKRIAAERKSKPITVYIPDEIVVSELAMRLKVTASEVVKVLFSMGQMATVNDVIDFDTASLAAMELHAKVEHEVVVTIEERIIDDSEDDDDNLVERAPVVVVMGHVDHGKTSLLDAIREENVTATEAGGITQHIGAYRAQVNGREITFLDTPGHEAFTTMRARGAQVTDIAILVVAADDGIMPQTVEAINHAKAADVSIIVAINKIDKEGANIDLVKQQLTEYNIVPEEWGGDVPCIPVSAKKKEGIEDLLEMVLLVADMKELKANPDRAAKGTVIEARLDKGRGPVATMLVQNGTLRVGDIVVAGTSVGKVRAMTNYRGERVKEAGPSYPVEITGLDEAPSGGDIFNAVSDERLARELVEQRKSKAKEELFNSQKPSVVTLDNLFEQMQQGDVKELKIIVKADVQGSVEAVKQSLEKLSNDEVRINVIHGAVGAIRESDVMLASASSAIIVGFNVRPDPVAEENAKRDGVDLRCYRIIYDCIEEIESAMKGMLAPKTREVVLGRAECRNVIKIKNVGFIAGSYVLSGKVARNSQVRVVRDGIVIFEDTMSSLQRFKDAVKEVSAGYECGIGLEKFSDLKEGDIIESFIIEEYRED